MYRVVENSVNTEAEFELPFEGSLSPENRWVLMSQLIPWSEFEEEYRKNFSEEIGAPALPFRMALGALIIKERLGTSDRETVEQIRENPYLQYFIGMLSYNNEAPFDPSMFVHFRKRINQSLIHQVNQTMVKTTTDAIEGEAEKKS